MKNNILTLFLKVSPCDFVTWQKKEYFNQLWDLRMKFF